MKKIILFSAALVLAITSSYAQHFDIRAYGGFNVLQLTSDNGTTLINSVLHNQRFLDAEEHSLELQLLSVLDFTFNLEFNTHSCQQKL